MLTDGFDLDANLQLDDPLSNGIGLQEDMHSTGKVDVNNVALVCGFG